MPHLDGNSATLLNGDPARVSSVHGVFVTEQRVDEVAFAERFAQIFLTGKFASEHFAQFKQVIRFDWFGWPYFADAAAFDPDDHIRVVRTQTSKKKMEEIISESLSTALDMSLPLWNITIFKNFQKTSAVLFKFHHCLADGFSMARILLQGCELEEMPSATSSKKGASSSGASWWTTLSKIPGALAKLLLQPQDPPSTLKPARLMIGSSPRAASWNECKLSISEMKALGKKTGSFSINDLMFSALCGALRRFALEKGQVPARMQTALWVALTPFRKLYAPVTAKDPIRWGNRKLGCVYTDGPLEIEDPYERLLEVKKRIRALIGTPEPFLASGILKTFGMLHKSLLPPIWNALAFKTTLSYSNVPGPQTPTKFLGSGIKSLNFYVPPVGTLGLFCTIMSLNDRATVALSSDETIVSLEESRLITGTFFNNEMRLLQEAILDRC